MPETWRYLTKTRIAALRQHAATMQAMRTNLRLGRVRNPTWFTDAVMNLELGMRLAWRSLGAALLLAVTLSGCETKITKVSVACRAGDHPTQPVRWLYTSKVDPSLINQIPLAIDITLHYTGSDPRAVPPITTYFYREYGAALRVASSAQGTLKPGGTFTYHVDTGGYSGALNAAGQGRPDQLAFVIGVDGSYFSGVMSSPTCGRWADRHLELGKAANVPDLKDRHPLNLVSADWLEVSTLPTAAMRREGAEVSTYAFFKAPIPLTEIKNVTSVPDDVTKQEAEVGVTPATPTFDVTGEPTPAAGSTPPPAQRRKS